jgi:hypothetical protein
MRQENDLHLIAHRNPEVLRHRAQGITDGGGDDAVELIHRTVEQHLKGKLRNGAVEGGTVLLGTVDGLGVAAPDSHRHNAGGIDELLGSIVGQDAHHFLAGGLILLEEFGRTGSGFLEFIQQYFDTHYALPSSLRRLFSCIASTRPCTRVSYWAALKLRGSA